MQRAQKKIVLINYCQRAIFRTFQNEEKFRNRLGKEYIKRKYKIEKTTKTVK